VVGNNTCEPVFSSEAQINVLSRSLSGKIFLQGLYRPNTGMMDKAQNENGDEFPANIADVISISLASATPPHNIEYTLTDIELATDGTFSCNLPSGSVLPYFIVINHRNSIETWGSVPENLYNNVNFFDFTQSSSKAFGNNMIQVGNAWTIFAGDVNQDDIVDADDMINIDNQSQVFGVGYQPEDINGDGLIDSSDLITVDNNSSTFVSVIKP
jgi:hypothetical protein